MAKRRHVMTPARRSALRKAQAASARKRRGSSNAKSTGLTVHAAHVTRTGYVKVRTIQRGSKRVSKRKTRKAHRANVRANPQAFPVEARRLRRRRNLNRVANVAIGVAVASDVYRAASVHKRNTAARKRVASHQARVRRHTRHYYAAKTTGKRIQ